MSVGKSIDDKSKKDTFDGSRKVINAAMERICEYTGENLQPHLLCCKSNLSNYCVWVNFQFAGTKIIFCDLRVPFIDNLYKPSVSGSRVDVLIEPLDMVIFFSLQRYHYVFNLLVRLLICRYDVKKITYR